MVCNIANTVEAMKLLRKQSCNRAESFNDLSFFLGSILIINRASTSSLSYDVAWRESPMKANLNIIGRNGGKTGTDAR